MIPLLTIPQNKKPYGLEFIGFLKEFCKCKTIKITKVY
jgi:hypothetical protein